MRWIRSASFIALSLFLHASLAVSWLLLQPMLSASTAKSMSVSMVTLAAPDGISQSVKIADNKPEGDIKPKIESDVEPKLALPVKKKVMQKKSIVKQNSKSKQLVERQIKKNIVEQSNQQQANISDDNIGVNNNQQASQMASPPFAIEGPKALRIQHPDYPDRARKLGKEGYVNVQYDIDENGRVVNLEVIDSSPRGMFEREVKRAMNRWYYEKIPAKGLKKTFLFKIDGSINLS